MPVEAVALVLGEDGDPEDAAVHEVREREVDQPVVAAERHGRLCAVGREGPEALALPTCQHDREGPRGAHGASLMVTGELLQRSRVRFEPAGIRAYIPARALFRP